MIREAQSESWTHSSHQSCHRQHGRPASKVKLETGAFQPRWVTGQPPGLVSLPWEVIWLGRAGLAARVGLWTFDPARSGGY